MIKDFKIENYGPIRMFHSNRLERLNLLIGPNKSGKTFVLKSLYTAIKTIEQYGRGKDIRKDGDILFDKLYWTFQCDSIGKIVSSGAKSLSFSMTLSEKEQFSYSFGPSTSRQIVVRNSCKNRKSDSIFIPAKEILSLRDLIIESREKDKSFGFDDTYYDLARALTPTKKGRNLPVFADARGVLESAIGGRIVFDESKKSWLFRDGRNEFNISLASEGIKKLSILDALLGNHYLSRDSIIFIDEPESALHPSLLIKFLDIVYSLSELGIQFFIASHSYFVIKKLYLLAQQNSRSIPVFSFEDGGVHRFDLHHEMPQNAIIDESIKLYKEEISL